MLSSQIFKRFQNYFGSNVLLWHSQASDKIKRDNWDKINSSIPYIVVGARSAIFAPLFNLGMIIIFLRKSITELWEKEVGKYIHWVIQ